MDRGGVIAPLPAAVPGALIRDLGLEPHPEGGYYRQVFKSSNSVVRGSDTRSALTAIYFLLPAGEHSAWHRVSSDEVWVPLQGASVRLHLFDGHVVTSVVVGPHIQPVPAGTWQAAEPDGEYALVTCFVGPGFEFEDFTLMRDDAAARERLATAAPELARLL